MATTRKAGPKVEMTQVAVFKEQASNILAGVLKRSNDRPTSRLHVDAGGRGTFLTHDTRSLHPTRTWPVFHPLMSLLI
jgi:hypothetical protein